MKRLWSFFTQVCVNFTVLTLLISVERTVTGHHSMDMRAMPQVALVIALAVGATWLIDHFMNVRFWLRTVLQVLAALAIVFLVGGGAFDWFTFDLYSLVYVVTLTVLCCGIVTVLYIVKGRRDAKQINDIIKKEGQGDDPAG